MELTQIAFGGGCHWCTEAVFQSLLGVAKVKQGWVSSTEKNNTFSEAVIVHFNNTIDLKTLIHIHLLTHKSTSNHSMRTKYRSAIYYFSKEQQEQCLLTINQLQASFKKPIITQVLPYKNFKPSTDDFQNYYASNPEKPFCKNYIEPKLKFLLQNFSKQVNHSKVSHLSPTTHPNQQK